MSSTKPPPPPPPQPPFFYTPLPAQPDDHRDYVVLLPRRLTDRRHMLCTASVILIVTLAALIAYVSWPSDPDLKIVRMRLTKIRIHRVPHLFIDASLQLTVKVRNPDVYSLDFGTLDVTVGYRGKELGHVRSEGGRVRALGSSYVDAELVLVGVDLVTDVFNLLENLAKGTVPFDTVTEVSGMLGLMFIKLPVKVKLSCEILVNTRNQMYIRKICYPE